MSYTSSYIGRDLLQFAKVIEFLLAFVEHVGGITMAEQCWTNALTSWFSSYLLIPIGDIPVQQRPKPSHLFHTSIVT